ncbi:hypothetical protein AJ80_09324 [Polytolypa hystricis UAMH7299]|uniref:Uncharacterized protein n=1 Tax=Polytolypa hystricis (strain UAMH7299) TaxID=1447883 RepID=A0A2B7WSQ7_POLH7|nr:hypothetical protein AJ80_09324 [Polytolypa hystricis UAMH7299]
MSSWMRSLLVTETYLKEEQKVWADVGTLLGNSLIQWGLGSGIAKEALKPIIQLGVVADMWLAQGSLLRKHGGIRNKKSLPRGAISSFPMSITARKY